MTRDEFLSALQTVTETVKEKGTSQNPVLIETIRLKDGSTRINKYRPFISSEGMLCVMKKGSQRRGYEFRPTYWNCEPVDLAVKYPDRTNTWRNSWTRAKMMLEKSGLWEDVLANIVIALDVGEQKIQAAYDLYWRRDDKLSLEENDALNILDIAKIDPRLGVNGRAHTSILWHMRLPAKIKKMFFGSNNNLVLARIRAAMMRKEECGMG